MLIVSINYLAVAVATLASMALGLVWYAPQLFGKQWMALTGITERQRKQNRGVPMALVLAGSLVTAYVMAHFVAFTNATTVVDGVRTGAWIGVGFVFTATLTESLFAHRPARLLAITGGYQVLNCILLGAILAAWR